MANFTQKFETMKPLIILIISFIISLAAIKLNKKQIDYQLAARIAMSCMLIFTAIGHFMFTKGMTAIIPDPIPFKSQMVIATGILEIVLAITLLLPKFQQLTAWILIVFFILIVPANIKAAIQQINYQTGTLNGPGPTYLWFRIPLQLLFILWIYLSAIRK
ncbi:membrane protein [Zhouia amylolytica AD3]|uniref:Membrane protein n=2 Tax=Zhouia amylolytica TaxID=376730 RepID=W2USH0_9FLAO|nr:membrane protein [Zhouia amylolytica AD3]